LKFHTRYRILLGFLIIIVTGFYFLTSWTIHDLRIQPLKASEEALVDMANILAASLELTVSAKSVDTAGLRAALDKACRRELSAKIYKLVKTDVNVRVYVTDDKGIVIFDSDSGRDEGRDYSEKNDVYLTLRGKYGARASKIDPDDFYSTVLYVASPIYSGDQILGVLTVAKPVESVKPFITQATRNLIIAAVLACIAAGILSFLISIWITRPIKKLTDYSRSIRDGKRVGIPELGKSEINDLGAAFEEMRDALEGKKYIEHYIQALTHEIKAPLTSIQGAAELLDEDMTVDKRRLFLDNIRNETARIQRLIDRLLRLTSLENKKTLQNLVDVDLAHVVREVVHSMIPVMDKKGIRLENQARDSVVIKGEMFLIRQAVVNLLKNAVEFTLTDGRITIRLETSPSSIDVIICDNGAGIPEYALDRVLDKFYSLPRPDTLIKSTGLGLSFVKEAAILHGGEIRLENNPEEGVTAILRLMRRPPTSADAGNQ